MLETWRDDLLLSQKTHVQFLALTWWLTTIHNPSSRGSSNHTCTHRCIQAGLELMVLLCQPPEYLRLHTRATRPLCSYLKCIIGYFYLVTIGTLCSITVAHVEKTVVTERAKMFTGTKNSCLLRAKIMQNVDFLALFSHLQIHNNASKMYLTPLFTK